MTNEDEQFVVDLTDAAASHAEWLGIVRFGMASLLERQELLVELIFREASKLSKQSGIKDRLAADDARAIFDELGLRIVTA